MESKKSQPEKSAPTLTLISFMLQPEGAEILQRLSADLKDVLGRKVSVSAVMRALVRHAGKQGYEWVTGQLADAVNEELSSGTVWGKKPGRPR